MGSILWYCKSKSVSFVVAYDVGIALCLLSRYGIDVDD